MVPLPSHNYYENLPHDMNYIYFLFVPIFFYSLSLLMNKDSGFDLSNF